MPEQPAPKYTISSISIFGDVLITFSQKLLPLEAPETLITEQSIGITLSPTNPSLVPLLDMIWEFVSLEGMELRLKLIFKNAIFVSSDSEGLDTLWIDVK